MARLDPVLQRGLTTLTEYLRQRGIGLVVTSTRRSRKEQARLYRAYVSGRSAYPAAPPGTSAHELGYAFDAVTQPRDYQTAVGRLWESMGGEWGGRYSDPVHFQLR